MSSSSKVDVLFCGRSQLQKIWSTFKKVVATGQAFRSIFCSIAFASPIALLVSQKDAATILNAEVIQMSF